MRLFEFRVRVWRAIVELTIWTEWRWLGARKYSGVGMLRIDIGPIEVSLEWER